VAQQESVADQAAAVQLEVALLVAELPVRETLAAQVVKLAMAAAVVVGQHRPEETTPTAQLLAPHILVGMVRARLFQEHLKHMLAVVVADLATE